MNEITLPTRLSLCSSSALQKQLESKLRKIINEKDLSDYQTSINIIASELDVNSVDCAAALLYLLQENFKSSHDQKKFKVQQTQASALQDLRMLWYRLEVGREHQVNVDMLKQLLVEESGVDLRLIARVDIRDKYTLIQIPNGMPQELLQHLKKVAINQQQLGIKRLKNRPNRKSRNIKNKAKRSGNTGHLDNKSTGSGDKIQKQHQTEESASDKRVAAHFLAKS